MIPSWLYRKLGYKVLESMNLIVFEMWSQVAIRKGWRVVREVHMHCGRYRLIWKE